MPGPVGGLDKWHGHHFERHLPVTSNRPQTLHEVLIGVARVKLHNADSVVPACGQISRDPLGDWQVIVLNPLGRALNLGLRLALEHRLHARLGYRPQCLHHDDGVLIRLTESEEPVVDLFAGITSDNVRDMILEELADSALFALRFRQNAARALLSEVGNLAEKVKQYRASLQRDFMSDLEFGSRLAKRFYLGKYMFGAVPARMVQFTRCSPRFRSLMQDLFAGKQPYRELKTRLLKNIKGSLYEIVMSFGFSRVVPRKAG